MNNPDLQKYVEEQRQAKVPEPAIREALVKSGWPTAQIDEVLTPNVAPPPTAMRTETTLRTKRFLLLIIGIAVVLILVGVLIALHYTRNKVVPFGG